MKNVNLGLFFVNDWIGPWENCEGPNKITFFIVFDKTELDHYSNTNDKTELDYYSNTNIDDLIHNINMNLKQNSSFTSNE